MVFAEPDQPFLLHPSQFLRQSRAVHIEIIRQLLAVKGNVEFPASPLDGDGVEVGEDPSPDGFG